MTDFNNEIAKLEKEREKIIKIVEAQKKLDEMISYRLEDNLEVFKKYFPNIYNLFKDYKPSKKYKITCNENGEPNIFDTSNQTTMYSTSPFDDSKKQVEKFLEDNKKLISINLGLENDHYKQIHFRYKNKFAYMVNEEIKDCSNEFNQNNYPLVFMLGLGLGFQLGYLYESVVPINMCIVEPDMDLFYFSLCVFDYGPLIEYIVENNYGLKFCIGITDENRFILEIEQFLAKYPFLLGTLCFYYSYTSDTIIKLYNTLKRDANSICSATGFFDDAIIGMSHSGNNISNKVPLLLRSNNLPEEWCNTPILVIGNGPSLDECLPIIKKYQDKFIILACGTALTTLSNYGIVADIYVAVERIYEVYESLLHVKDKLVFEKTLCITPDVIHPMTLSLFKNKIISFKPSECMLPILTVQGFIDDYKKFQTLDEINPLVSNMGMTIARLLKFNQIYMVGIDNGSAYAYSHSKFSHYYDEDKGILDSCKDMDTNVMNSLYPGNFCEQVKTNDLFKKSIRIMEHGISIYKQLNQKVKYFNCGNGAKVIGAEPLHFDTVDWNKYPSKNKNELISFIINKMSEVVNLTKEDFPKVLQTEEFVKVIDVIIDDWNKFPKTRIEYILKEELHLDYLSDNIKAGFPAIQATVSGTLAALYTYVNVILYSEENEIRCIEKTKKYIDLIIEILGHFKKVYPQTFDCIHGDGKEFWNM